MTGMGWQELAVAVVVAAAVTFLVRRVVGRRERRKAAQTFVPLSRLRKPGPPSDQEPGCH